LKTPDYARSAAKSVNDADYHCGVVLGGISLADFSQPDVKQQQNLQEARKRVNEARRLLKEARVLLNRV
jgi:hypothetical protein